MRHKIIISGGGTGGHIFPAIAIGKAIEVAMPHSELLFIGAYGRMEMQKVPESGFNIRGLWISGFQRRLSWKNIIFPLKLCYSLLQALRIIYQFKPDLVIGTGGYASGPLLFLAAKKNIPTLIQEQNSYPGITNRILGKDVDKVCVAYDNMCQYFPVNKVLFTGNPIRKDIIASKKLTEPKNNFGVNNKKLTVLVIGGSLGARSINNAIYNNLDLLVKEDINLLWQTGKQFNIDLDNIISKRIKVFTFIKRMDLAYASADIIISRAGAIAISELCCIGKPVILVPSPNVSENHQYKNAQSLVNKNAALLVDDKEASCKLVQEMINLLRDSKKRNNLSKNIKKLAMVDATERIVKVGIELLER